MKGIDVLRRMGIAFALSVFAAVPAAQAGSTVSFHSLGAYLDGGNGGPGPEETSTVVADFNGDGIPDIAMCDGTFYGVGFYVLLGKGDGTFKALPQTVVNFEVGALQVGDFNGDGIPDLVATNDTTAYVLLGNGDGSFTRKASYVVPQFQQDNVAVTDLNHDGVQDLVITTHLGPYVLLGNGDGSFRYPGILSPQISFGVSGLATGNFFGSGNVDLAVSDAITQQIYMLRGNGDGTFTPVTTLGTQWVPGTLMAKDLNRDGIDDVVSSNEANELSKSLQVNLSDGAGGWSRVATYDGGVAPVSGALADLNGDGSIDIVSSDTIGQNEVILLNNGDGTFGAPIKLSTLSSAWAPQTPVIADFNRDGRKDLAVGGVLFGLTSLQVWLQQ